MNELIQLDQAVFHWINEGWQHPWLDLIMPYWREKTTWIPLYILLAAFVLYRFRLKGLYFMLAAVLTIGIADATSSRIVKPAFERLRPCNDPAFRETVQLKIPCGPGYSFTSSHATNHLALAAFLALTLGRLYRRWRWPFYLWAISIALGQVYVGVHYPLDILAGGLLGLTIGSIVAKMYLRFPQISIVPRLHS